MSAIKGSTARNRNSEKNSRLQEAIAVGEGQARLNAVVHNSDSNQRALILAHDGEQIDSSMLESVIESLVSTGWKILEVQLVRDDETEDRLIRYDIPLLARRLADVQRWAERHGLGSLSIVLGTGNASAAALWLSTQRFSRITAVLSVNGRPHLAEPALGSVKCPTLLLVDPQDGRALHMNRMAAGRLGDPCELREMEQGRPLDQKLVVHWLDENSGDRSDGKSMLRSRSITSSPALSLLRSLISIGVFFALLTSAG